MRYIRTKTITTKIVDEIIENMEDIECVISSIKKNDISCSLRIEDNPKFENVRIIDIDNADKKFTFKIIHSKSTLQKTAYIKDIHVLEVNTNSEIMAKVKGKVSRWQLLDPGSSIKLEEQ